MQNAITGQAARDRQQRSRAGALWLVQAISGLLLVLLLGLHMVAHHFVAAGGLRNFQEVLAYVSNPAIFFIEVVFLVFVTTHAMLGLRAVVRDLGLSPSAARAIDWVLALVGAGALAYGLWLAVAIQRL
ncbi:MAG: hypothetical protein KC418_01225 [Anaerolineales bacterium]|nr:hypothetical protein [Anaerolineales bacterium]MCB8952752.1 hypothetical protein [Ardenticatenales bacterium]